MTLHLFLAQQVPPDLSGWLTGSAVTVLAFVVVAFLRGWIIAGPTHARALAKQDEQAAEIRRLHVVFEEKVIPALVRSTDLMARVADSSGRERTG